MKCIVVHVADDRGYKVRLNLGVELAVAFDAHLNVIYVTPQPHNPAAAIGRAVSMEYLAEAEEFAQQKAGEIKDAVRRACEKRVASWEWHFEQGDVDHIVARFAHLSDLLIVGQEPHSLLEDVVVSDITDYLLMSAGCPLLIVPVTWQGDSVGDRVLIAWKNTRQAIDAIRGSLSFLRKADEVLILAAEEEDAIVPPGEDIARYLSYHDVPARVIGSSIEGGRDILDTAKKNGCDLIVMGAYAHSRLSKWFFGGATDYILRNASLPVLMRH
jgi:nucleotide-binding universal stress UspA family protein